LGRASPRGPAHTSHVVTLALSLALLVSSPALPAEGVLTPGESLGGVQLGDTTAAVTKRWGSRHTSCALCKRTTWLYSYRGRGPAGAAVSFRNERVAAVFTLGVPRGWRTSRGVALGDPAERVQALYGRLPWSRCIGYGALSIRRPGVVSSIYTYGESVYGFALTLPAEPVCQ
jgi:hypothetical protein